MCGIAGFSLAKTEEINAHKLARQLLLEIEERGRHATGEAWVEEDGMWYSKRGVRASRYEVQTGETATAAILHTRYATTGDPADNNNNHPIVLPGILGVHNGIVDNHHEIVDLLDHERVGAVDSEAIFAAVSEMGPRGLNLVDGDAAVAWLEVDRPDEMWLARLTGRPLALGQTKRGSAVFASTQDHLVMGALLAGVRMSNVWTVPRNTLIRIKRGVICDVERVGAGADAGSLIRERV